MKRANETLVGAAVLAIDGAAGLFEARVRRGAG